VCVQKSLLGIALAVSAAADAPCKEKGCERGSPPKTVADFVQEKQLEVLGEVWISSLRSTLCFSLPAPKPCGLWL